MAPMTIRRTHLGWALKAWVFAAVFTLPFLEGWEVFALIGLGGALGLAWRALPEEPEVDEPVQPLPYADRYRDRQIPRPERRDD